MTGQSCGIYRICLDSESLRPKEISQVGYEFLPHAVRHYMTEICADNENVPETDELDCYRFEIERSDHGKPFFPHHPEIKFNISNSGDWIYLAVTGVEVGIDIQEVTGMEVDRVAKRVFAPEEYAEFLGMEDKRQFFFREWALRESYIKWTGKGLAQDMRYLPHDAWQERLPAPQGYEAAITAAGPLSCIDTDITYDRQKGFIWKK